MKKRLLYIAPHRPGRSPGQRFRFEQYMDFLLKNGYDITYSYILSKADDKVFYRKGRFCLKLWIAVKAFFIRCYDVLRANRYDIILIYREAHFFGFTLFEKLFAMSRAKMVFDFDDAIWMNDTSEGNKNLKWLKRPAKIGTIIKLSDVTIAGNSFLANYAKLFNKNVVIIPTTIDTNYHNGYHHKDDDTVTIGWTGSSTTIKHFETAVPFLIKLKKRYGNRLSFKVIVDIDYENEKLQLKSTRWSKETEIEELSKIDIGIMPLPDDKWSKGKCGFKGIQYMALEKATVMSPVGVNVDIVQDGVNGFLAKDDSEWFKKLSMLIDDKELREKIGKAGRTTVEQKYSVNSQQDVFLNTLNSLL